MLHFNNVASLLKYAYQLTIASTAR